MSSVLTPPLSDKPRYTLLDGLRGVGALIVIIFHFGEAFSTGWQSQIVNHGYLAVDFFFILSGFVIGYAYDGRWRNGKMTASRFMLRRFIRLHPMVVLAILFGAATYILQGCVRWDGTPMPPESVIIALICGLFLLPAIPGTMMDVRGNAEMFPLNGPQWSLFFEYIASLFYAIFLHRFSTRLLRIFVIVSGIGLAVCTYANFSGGYTMGYGWSILGWDIIPCGGMLGGLFHVSFCFGLGLLMTRDFKPRTDIRGSFWICSALLLAVCVAPYITLDGDISMLNATYDLLCTFIIMPAIVWIGAHGVTTDRISTVICEGLGNLSYPLYIVHYPLMYLFYSWVWSNSITFTDALPVMACIFVTIPVIAWLALKYYDEPVRNYLTSRWLRRSKK